MTKQERYDQLVADVIADYRSRDPAENVRGPQLIWCKDCLEINLWTYWQGSLDAKIMLVGQDWGCADESKSVETAETLRRIRSVNEQEGPPFFPVQPQNTIWPTDSNLIKLFKILDYDIMQKQPDLFFTNLVLGYRDHGTSGQFQTRWARRDASYYQRLVEIIEPKIIICLGKNTYEGVIYALSGTIEHIKGFNRFLDSGSNWKELKYSSGKKVSVFAVAHCGTIGTMNRNRGRTQCGRGLSSNDLSAQEADWERIRSFI